MFSGLKVAMRLNAWRSQLTSAIKTRLLADRWLYVAIAAYCLAGLMLLVICGQSTRMAYSLYFEQWTYLFLFFMPAVALLLDAAWIIVRFNEKRLMAIRRALSPQRLAHLLAGMALLMALMFFQGTFTSIKNILPHLRGGFLYDRILADIDVWVSFGREPGLFLASFWGGGLLSRSLTGTIVVPGLPFASAPCSMSSPRPEPLPCACAMSACSCWYGSFAETS
jgi:hypothetical protein